MEPGTRTGYVALPLEVHSLFLTLIAFKESSSDGKDILTSWRDKKLELPAVWKGKANPNAEVHAIHGRILDRKTDE